MTTPLRLGIVAAWLTAGLIAGYALVLGIGLISLESPDDPIGDPMFTILEVLILLLMPAMVAMMAALHAWAETRFKALTLVALLFTGLLAGLTSVVHFLVLTLSRDTAFMGQSWAPLVLSFRWPSIVYALDILAWDLLFPWAMFFAAPAVVGSQLADRTRRLMVASGVLALLGLGGVVAGNMQLRNIGILGYVVVFCAVAVCLAKLFRESAVSSSPAPRASH